MKCGRAETLSIAGLLTQLHKVPPADFLPLDDVKR